MNKKFCAFSLIIILVLFTFSVTAFAQTEIENNVDSNAETNLSEDGIQQDFAVADYNVRENHTIHVLFAQDSAPKTADRSNTEIWVLLAIMATCTLILLYRVKYGKKLI